MNYPLFQIMIKWMIKNLSIVNIVLNILKENMNSKVKTAKIHSIHLTKNIYKIKTKRMKLNSPNGIVRKIKIKIKHGLPSQLKIKR